MSTTLKLRNFFKEKKMCLLLTIINSRAVLIGKASLALKLEGPKPSDIMVEKRETE